MNYQIIFYYSSRTGEIEHLLSDELDDRKYQDTIRHDDDFYPSPSIFVYTLPNIVTGEIAIRHHYYGETAFYVLNEHNEQMMHDVLTATFADDTTTSAVTGWIDCETKDQFNAYIYIVEK